MRGSTFPSTTIASVTGHGTVMAYVFPTLVAMGFGYAITELALQRPLIGLKWAWAAFGLVAVGAFTAATTVAMGAASVLYTFYPPLIGSPFYYIGIVLAVVGSWIWVALMAINLYVWRKANAGRRSRWRCTRMSRALRSGRGRRSAQPSKFSSKFCPLRLASRTPSMRVSRAFCSRGRCTPSCYFWLMPAYIAFYTIVPRAIGGRLYSDAMARLSFALFLVFAMPIGIHHLFADPQVGSGFKYVHSVFTAMVVIPTLLTVFTICASVEIAARLRGGRGMLGWVRALPWRNPAMLALALSFIMLGFGGAGGIINMSYQLDSTIHNTQWITGHFHLIFAGAVVIMYFIIAYDLWPHLTGRALGHARLIVCSYGCGSLGSWS